MAANGVIGGFLGAAIAVAIMPYFTKRARARHNKKEHQDPETYRPGASIVRAFWEDSDQKSQSKLGRLADYPETRFL